MSTPARKQYLRIKKQHQDEVLLFRMGDFYETFDNDARLISRELEIALTSREMGKGTRVPLAGIPYHALDGYLAKLIKKGYRVAICEQTSDPATSRGIVDREVVRVVTPGTVIEDSILDRKANNYLAARRHRWQHGRPRLRGHHHQRVRHERISRLPAPCGACRSRSGRAPRG